MPKLTVKDYKDLEARINANEEKTKALEDEKKASEEKIKALEDEKKTKEDESKENEIKLKKYEDDKRSGFLNPDQNTTDIAGHRMNSDEAQCKGWFGVSDVKDLLHVNTMDRKYSRVPDKYKYLVIQLKNEMSNARMIAQMFHDAPRDKISQNEDRDRIGNCKCIGETYYGKNILIPRIKAFGSSTHADWIPTGLSSTFIAEYELVRELVGAFKDIPCPTSPYEMPTATGLTKARRATENVSATVSNFVSGKVTFTASKWLEYYEIPEELQEDSAPNVLEMGRQELVNAHLRGFESAIINGTKIGTVHIDTDTQAGGADLGDKQFHGLRYYGLGNTANGGDKDFGNAVVSDALLAGMRQQMGKFGVHPNELLWIPGATSYLQMVNTENVVTVDKMGPAATVLRGQLGQYAGIPIITSGWLREDMNASGVHDGVVVDRTGILLIHRDRWYFGTRRPIRMALREAASKDDRYEIASYSRNDFQPAGAQSTKDVELTVVYGYNIPTT